MTRILILVGALIALKLLQPMIRVLIAALFGKAVGDAALAKQPDTIHLTRAEGNVWKDRAKVGALAGGFRPCGFEDAGTYTIDELKDVSLRLMTHARDALYAVVYEHAKVGVWADVVTRYTDGTSVTFTTSKPTGLKHRPGHPVYNLPNVGVEQLVAKAMHDRPEGTFAAHGPDSVVRDFEAAWAESMAWRKGNGVSTREVVNVAVHPRKAA